VKVYGKERRTRRGVGRTPDRKKAIVTLKEGQALGGVLGQAFEAA
jgi:ribosomal protein L23